MRRAGRQSGHCYLAGRSKLSPLISAVMSEENTSHQRIFIQRRVEERSEAKEKHPSVVVITISGNMGKNNNELTDNNYHVRNIT